MKKLLSILLVILVITGCVGMTGCASSGVYKFSSLTNEDGNKFEVGEKYNFITLDEDFYTIELKDDGTCIMRTLGIPVSGTYKKSLFSITMFFGDDEIEVKAFFGRLVFEEDDTKIVLTKK